MLISVKQAIKNIPVVGPALQRTAGLIRKQPVFLSSAQFWEDRYRTGGDSGSGSYNRLARFKAEVLNDFVSQNQVASVIEFGCGDGAQLALANYPRYTGVDVSKMAVAMCRRRFCGDSSKSFMTVDTLPSDTTADLALSLDVIYHLIEDSVFDIYMNRLFNSANRFVIIYSSNENKMWPVKHVRHRKFTDWIDKNRPGWTFLQSIKNKYPYDPANTLQTSFADFYVFHKKEQTAG